MDRKFFLLDNKDNGYKFGVHLEHCEFGVIGIVNFHFVVKEEYEILLTDRMGVNFYAKMRENPFSFSLPKEFVVDDELKIDIFERGCLVGSWPQKEDASNQFESKMEKSNNDENIFKEVEYYINRAKEVFGGGSGIEEKKLESYFFDTIKEDFELLYSIGVADYSLTRKFRNSVWKKIDIGSDVYLLGKIYKNGVSDNLEVPSFVAIALSTTKENAHKNLPLGDSAKFYNANIYDSFGYLVLVENTRTGWAVNL